MPTFQVPQFIDREDKIIGPLSLRQFIILAITGGLLFALFKIFQFWLFFIIGGIIAALGMSLAFIKVNGQRFDKVALNALRYFISPRLYVWRRPEKSKQLSVAPKIEVKKKVEEQKRMTLEQLEEFAKKLDE